MEVRDWRGGVTTLGPAGVTPVLQEAAAGLYGVINIYLLGAGQSSPEKEKEREEEK